MCRHLGYLGPAVPVSDPLTRGEHSLRVQSWAPREMRGGGTVNADGFGVAWWSGGGRGNVRRYRNAMPIWTDPAVDEVLSEIRSRAVLAAVRSATVGMPVERTACAPFVDGRWAFSHNGLVPEWRRTVGAAAADIGGVDPLELEASTDSAGLWLLLRACLQAHTPESAIVEVIKRVAGVGARLNLILGDGEQFWATTYYHSLSVLVTDESVCVSSEPYDDNPDWQPVPDRRLVIARPGSVSIEQL